LLPDLGVRDRFEDVVPPPAFEGEFCLGFLGKTFFALLLLCVDLRIPGILVVKTSEKKSTKEWN
jgi:hypothetical protein